MNKNLIIWTLAFFLLVTAVFAQYNMEGLANNTTNMLTFIKGVSDELTFGWLGVLYVISISVIFWVVFTQVTGDAKKALSAASYLSFIIAILFRAVDLIPNKVLFVTLAISAAVLAFTWGRRG